MPPHSHPIEQTPHGHTAQQNAHNHGITTGDHAHGITTGNHSHSIPYNLVDTGLSGMTSGGSSFGLRGGQNTNAVGNLGGNTDTAGNLGGFTDTQAPGVGVNAAYANINNNATDNAGGGAGHNTVPPYIALNFIIRFA